MKEKIKNKNGTNIPNPDDFWPEAKELLDKHYATKKRIALFWRWGSALAIVMLLGTYFKFSFTDKESTKLNVQSSNSQHIINTQTANKINEPSTSSNMRDAAVVKASNAESSNTGKLKINPTAITNTNNLLASNKAIKTITNKRNVIKKNDDNNIPNYDKTAANNPSQVEKDLVVVKKAETRKRQRQRENLRNTNVSISSPETSSPANSMVSLLNRMEWGKLQMPSYVLSNYYEDANQNFYPISITDFQLKIDDDYVDNKNLSYSLGAYFGIQNVSKKIILNNNEYAEYAQRRTNEENNLITNFYGFSFNINKNKLVLKTGFEYNTIGETNNYKPYSKQWKVNDISDYEITNVTNLKVDTVYHFGIKKLVTTSYETIDSIYVTKFDSTYGNFENKNIALANQKTKLSYIEIPLLIGYKINFKNFCISPMAGISVGYLTGIKGSYSNEKLTGTQTISETKSFKNIVCNYNFQLQFGYTFNNNFMVYIAPQFRANANSATRKNFIVSQKYQSIGGLAGVSYLLK